MATRFRLTSDTTAPDVSPALLGTYISGHTSPTTVRRKLLTVDTSALTTLTYTPDAADHLVAGAVLSCQFVSDTMAAGISFTTLDTIKFAIQWLEANAGNNLFVIFNAAIVSSDGATVRRRLATDDSSAAGELATTLTNRFYSTVDAGATYVTVAGDRIVVEFGLTGTPAAAGGVQGHNASFRFGGNGAGGDLAENQTETGTTFNPWFEFVPTITFGGAGRTTKNTRAFPLGTEIGMNWRGAA